VSDAELVRALIAEAGRSNVRRFALWRLGLEDPAVWEVLKR
jgi:spore germination protein YaaH